jgi:DNA mismatch endonuclease (patch repair protein)
MASKAPSFKGFQAASITSSRSKQANKRRDTVPELLLRRELWRMGLRFRKNAEALPGKPDIVFTRAKVAVFCDGDFWHGRDWLARSAKLSQGTNARYWLAKIEANMERDARNTALLQQAGWQVVRLWELDIKRDPRGAACRVRDVVQARYSRAQQGDRAINS